MYPTRSRTFLILNTAIKHEINSDDPTDGSGALSPDVRPNNQLQFSPIAKKPAVKKLGKYFVSGLPDDSFSGTVFTCQAFDTVTKEEVVCKVLPVSKYKEILSPYWVVGSHRNINNIREIVVGSKYAYVFFDSSFEDLHSYVRKQRKLKDDEACRLFAQIVSAVEHCHENGVVLRDLKLRKFVFKDHRCSHLVLDNLEDSCVLTNPDDDLLTDRHGCPAYVSPEILFSSGGYSGKSADVWSLGVVLYTMLAGQYPFHDVDVGSLFKKIRQGVFVIPDGASTQAKCLLKNLLRTDPSERLRTDEILSHPWFNNRPPTHMSPPLRRLQQISSLTASNAALFSVSSSSGVAVPSGATINNGVSLLATPGNSLTAFPSSSSEEPNYTNSATAENFQKTLHNLPDQTVPQLNLLDTNEYGNRFFMVVHGSV